MLSPLLQGGEFSVTPFIPQKPGEITQRDTNLISHTTLSFFTHSTLSLLYFVISSDGRGVGNGPSIPQPLLMPLMGLLKEKRFRLQIHLWAEEPPGTSCGCELQYSSFFF